MFQAWVAVCVFSALCQRSELLNAGATAFPAYVPPATITQEGKSDVEFLREEELVNGLHVSSRSYKPITCYQISPKGKVGKTVR